MATQTTLIPEPLSLEAAAALKKLTASKLRLCSPPPTLKVSDWADTNRYLPPGSSPQHGDWECKPYQREMMDCILEPGVEEFVFMTSTQVGKSEALNNIIGYIIDLEPAPVMIVQPTTETAKDYSKMRIQRMIENCPALRLKVREAKSRQPGNEIRLKEFDGGYLKIAGANSGPGLRSHPVAKLFFDEEDAYLDEIPGEGDPIVLATRRTDAFAFQRLIGHVSTPKKPKGLSRIEAAWKRSDQRRFHVPCPFCGAFQALRWGNKAEGFRLVWEKDEQGRPRPETVRYACESCDKLIEEKWKNRMLAGGHWVKERPESPVAGFHLNALYSPWEPIWAKLSAEWATACKSREGLREFINLRMGETFEESAESAIEPHILRARAERYFPITCDTATGEIVDPYLDQRKLPEGICLLTASCDTQHNRLEAQIMGWAPTRECWLLDYKIFWGNPGVAQDPDSGNEVWTELDDWLLRPWHHAAGVELTPAVTFVDSGYHAESVYKYVTPRQLTRRRIFACKGVDYLQRPGLVMESTTKKWNIRLFIVSTYAAKDLLFARLNVPMPGPDYIHFPDWITDEYFEQLTSERRIPVVNKRLRTTRSVWVKMQERNEALDNTVYNFAALAALQQFIAPQQYRDLAKYAATLGQKREPPAARKPNPNWIREWPR